MSSPQSQLRQWLLALRDLCDQGATGASVTIGGGAIITYSPAGAFVIAGERTLRIGDEWLDRHGFVLSDVGRVASIGEVREDLEVLADALVPSPRTSDSLRGTEEER